MPPAALISSTAICAPSWKFVPATAPAPESSQTQGTFTVSSASAASAADRSSTAASAVAARNFRLSIFFPPFCSGLKARLNCVAGFCRNACPGAQSLFFIVVGYGKESQRPGSRNIRARSRSSRWRPRSWSDAGPVAGSWLLQSLGSCLVLAAAGSSNQPPRPPSAPTQWLRESRRIRDTRESARIACDPDLDFAATRPRCGKKRGGLLLHHHFADIGRGREQRDVDRHRIAGFHAERRRIDDDIEHGRVVRSNRDLETRIVLSSRPARASIAAALTS